MKIRPYRASDISSLYEISLATGLAGGDASTLFEDQSVIGHIYAAPYASLKPELAWVAVDESGVCGYVVGVDDTFVWESRLEYEWWPMLRNRYINPKDGQHWTWDERHIRLIFQPERTPLQVSKAYPAHIHMNLLPRAQKKGVGTLLLDHWLSAATDMGIEAVHVAVNPQNGGGLMFWRRQGFVEIDPRGTGRTIWMGRLLSRR